MTNVKITVFTPVYNRGYCIRNVYESLIKQKFQNFEWLVINDGSKDDTDKVIRECIAEEKIKINYYVKENGGQHRALNDAIERANGLLLMIVDSDDDLTENALELIDYYEKTIADCERYAGVAGLRGYRNGQIIGQSWPSCNNDFIDLKNTDRYKKNMLLGDKAEAYYLKVLKKYYPIPEFKNENDVEKGVLWNRISNAGFTIRWFNKIIYNCEYLSDGMSKNIDNNYLRNFKGYTFYIKEFVKCDIGKWRRIKTLIVYCELARKKKLNAIKCAKLLEENIFLMFILYIISFATPLRKKIRRQEM